MSSTNIHESWAQSSKVSELLRSMLAFPFQDHSAAVRKVLEGELCNAHAIGLVRASNKFDAKQAQWRDSVVKSKAIAYHVWLYHFLHGGETKLTAPTLAPSDVSSFTERLRTDAVRFEAEFKRDVERLSAQARRGSGTASSDLETMRSTPIPLGVLRLVQVQAQGSAGAAAAGGGGGGGGGGATEWQQHTDSLYAFAMGTHERLGIGYESRDEPCAVRLVAHDHDALHLIASYVRGTTRRTLAPPKRELRVVRDRLKLAEAERFYYRELSEDRRVEAEIVTVQLEQSLRREADLHRQLDARDAAAAQVASDHEQELASVHATSQRAVNAERKRKHESDVQWQLKVNASENSVVDRLRDQDAELRSERVRLAADRCDAQRALQEAQQAMQQMQQQVERVRSSSKAKLQGELAEKAAELAKKAEELRQARARRTGTMKRVQELNLLPRRLKLAEQRATDCQEALADYCVEELGLQAAMARADAAEKQLLELRRELEAETAAREKYQVSALSLSRSVTAILSHSLLLLITS